MGPMTVVGYRNDVARRCREGEGWRVVMGGEEEGWEKIHCCGEFIKQLAM